MKCKKRPASFIGGTLSRWFSIRSSWTHFESWKLCEHPRPEIMTVVWRWAKSGTQWAALGDVVKQHQKWHLNVLASISNNKVALKFEVNLFYQWECTLYTQNRKGVKTWCKTRFGVKQALYRKNNGCLASLATKHYLLYHLVIVLRYTYFQCKKPRIRIICRPNNKCSI